MNYHKMTITNLQVTNICTNDTIVQQYILLEEESVHVYMDGTPVFQ